ncbi:MAG: sulfatase-like hydrolase/transferase [Clostridia bacterium]|nr:sulfatase-like hydrolase/transferase [Clostridia bacterium]
MKKILKQQSLVWCYIIIATIIELLGVFVTSGKFYIRSPGLFILIQSIFVLILLSISNHKAKHVVASVFLALFAIINLVFIVIFEMTETMFDYGMLNLRNDGMAILESVPINFVFFSITMLMIALFIVFGARFVRHNEKSVKIPFGKIIVPISLVVVFVLNSLVLYFNNRNFQEDVQAKLYRSSEASYCELGITANFINELFKGQFFSHVKLGDEEELEKYIYKDITLSNFSENASKDYNVVSVLVESWEWHSFVQDFDLFMNGYNIKYQNYINPNTSQPFESAEEVLKILFPNIYDFYYSSIALTNFYSREKTDIAENLSLIGSYPTNAYVNYDFPKNEIASSLPNVLKTLDSDIDCSSFHNGSGGFYNRDTELISAGFDSFTASEEMCEKGMKNWQAKGERNLDSDMIRVCADEMFPTDERFYTYITTITMHGQYTYRKNLDNKGFYDKMEEYGIKAMKGTSEKASNHNNFYYYCACVMEFDEALGEIQNELETRGLKDNTIILMFGDHNTYYSSLSNYVKGINNTNNKNYTNLFRVPCMIQYPNMEEIINFLQTNKSDKIGTRYEINDYVNSKGESVKQIQVKKFCCTADIVPTLFDLLGINYYSNLYFGHSIFADTVSVLYSRAYDIFITDSMYFVSLNNIKYIRADQPTTNKDPALKYADISSYDSEDHINEVEDEAKLMLKKLDSCNRIFYNDYFARKNINDKTKTNVEIFKDNLINIQ